MSKRIFTWGEEGVSWKWADAMKNWRIHLRDHWKGKLWVAGKITEIETQWKMKQPRKQLLNNRIFGNGCCAASRKVKSLYLLDVGKVQGSKEVVIGNTVLYCRCFMTIKRKWSRCYLFMPHPDNSLQKNTQDKKKKMRKHTRKKQNNNKKKHCWGC